MDKRLKYFLIFVLFFNGCSDEHELKTICSPFRMTISDAIPIQFWVNGVETYNQKEVCGITPVCFCQPFNCDDEIRIQFQDSDFVSYYLVIYDSVNNEITRLLFSEIQSDIFQLSFVPNELSICDENIRLDIVPVLQLLNPNIQSSLHPWRSAGNPNPAVAIPWTFANPGAVASFISVNTTHVFGQPFNPISANVAYSLNYRVTVASYVSGTLEIWAAFSSLSGTTLFQETTPRVSVASNGVHTGTIVITETSSVDAALVVLFGLKAFSSTTGPTITINSLTTDIIDLTTLASSDCIDVRESHDCTQLIRYDNSKDFADIEYTDFSPTAEFYIRIPAIFFHERNTEEQERFETSGETIVRLRDEIKVKRLLEVGYMPDYMHRKLLLILAHDTIEIDSETWVRNDPYEKIDPANKRYPLKRAQVLLTQQGYIKRNIL